jgi:hypothetical protein
MGLSLEQRRAVSWSACRAALEKYEGQQGCNELVLKMLIDSSAVIDAAFVEGASRRVESSIVLMRVQVLTLFVYVSDGSSI